MALAQGFNPADLNATELAMSAAMLIALGGMSALWRWEVLGGLLVIGGMLAFYVINIAATGRFPGGWALPAFFVPGVLALACSVWDRSRHRADSVI